jgi:hypothetical protein
MVDGATIYFSAPFVWRHHGYPSDYYRYTAEAVKVLFERVEWEWLGYIDSDGIFSDKPPKNPRFKTKKLLQRCEVVGFGVKV